MRSAAFVTFVIVASAAVSTQSVTIATEAGVLHLRAPGFAFIEGVVADRLREGRSVRVDLELAVLDQPGGRMLTEARQSYALSFDLWEERFAVTRIGAPARSISHRTAKSAEAWCLENLTIPLTALSRLGRQAPFWIRLGYRLQDAASAPEGNGDDGLTLTTLIDRLSRRRDQRETGKTVEAGPFRLAN